ncbi:MAG: Inositol-1-monophosphatase [Chlamydiae bacterium]|nr:Inositol-1-monophosphatase [Chlamydiota bacterium]
MNLIEVAKHVAKGAGEILKEGFGTSFQIESKEGKQNLVTEYDVASQKWIIEEIKKTFPTHTFLAEEKNIHDEPSDEILWIIDPLDGTVNFAHEVPFFAVSIAAAKGREIVAGCVYNPMLDELFFAEKGSGAFLGNRKLSVTKRDSLENAFVATGFPYNINENPLHCIDRFGKILEKGTPIRRLGAASLDICYVAAGRFDVFWEVGLHPWDMAAGKLILEEAEGKVSHYDGSPHQIFSYSTFLGTNELLHDEMVDMLKEDLL